MEKCGNCGVVYPNGYTSPMHTGDGSTDNICGICALELSNAYHGVIRKKFDGTMAEELRQNAIAWRKKKGIK